MNGILEKTFKLKDNSTTVGTEVRAGITTFFSMAYIIFVNPAILSATGMDAGGIMIATCLSAALGTLLCAFFSNKPYVMASGMGLNTFFAFTLCNPDAYGYTWQQALGLTFIAGFIFLAVTITPLRDKIIEAMPASLRHAITAGIGLFIALIGAISAGFVKMEDGFPSLGNLKDKQVIVALIGLAITAILTVRRVKGSLLIGMIATAVISMLSGLTGMPTSVLSMPDKLAEVAFKMDFAGLMKGKGAAGLAALLAVLFTMAMIDMFDTLGFLIGTGTFDGTDKGDGLVMIADAAGTVIGACCGTSTVTTYAESSAGVAAGGRTGLTALTSAVLFGAACFFAPLTSVMTEAAAAPALIIVGMYLLADVRNIDFSNMDDAIPAFLTLAAMPFSYSITTGIGAGIISYVICKLAAGKGKEVNPVLWVLAVVFLVYFAA